MPERYETHGAAWTALELPAVSEIQTVRLPRLRRPASYSRQFLALLHECW